MPPADATQAGSAAAFDASWLAARRWFRSKRRPLGGVAVADAVPLRATPSVQLLVLRAAYADGGTDAYLLPAVADPDGALREPRAGEGAWAAFAALIAEEANCQGATGRFEFRSHPALHGLLEGGSAAAWRLPEHPLEVEQSNSSVRLGDRLILKVYRLLEPGINPEVETTAFLAEVGFRWAPRLAGTVTWRPTSGEPTAAAMLQELIAARADGWDWMLRSLATPPQGPLEALAGVAQIGVITAEMHAALASRPDSDAFPAAVATDADLRAWRVAAERQLDAALASVAGRERERLDAIAGRVRERLGAIESAGRAICSRIHGDYHLGQLLRTESGFVVIDFEGEPARPLAERRLPASPLRDVAGMLRSFDYAARTAVRARSVEIAHDAWLDDARSAFLTAYGELGAGAEALLAAFEAEKACYEVRYEANNRPGWTWLPIEGLERMMG